MVKAVLFDAVGTLFRLRVPVGAVYLQHARRFGFDSPLASEEGLVNGFARSFRARPPLAFGRESAERVPALEFEWWRELVREVFEPYGAFPRFDEFFQSLFEAFAGSRHWILEPGCVDVLGRLRERGARTAVVSNFDSRLLSVLEGLGIVRFFDVIVVSSHCPTAKPDPGIFLTACTRLGVPPAESLHIGDSPVEDFQGAQSAGLRAVLYDPPSRHRDFQGERVTHLADALRLTS